MLEVAKTSLLDIARNRKADFVARDLAHELAPVDQGWLTKLPSTVAKHHRWLVELAHLLGQEDESEWISRSTPPDQNEPEITDEFIEKFFYAFPWPPIHQPHLWTPNIAMPSRRPTKWCMDVDCWDIFSGFLCSLTWNIKGDACWSYLELAAIFILRGFRFSQTNINVDTFKTFIPIIKKASTCVLKGDGDKILPGHHNPDRNKPVGKTLPSGTIDGAEIVCSREELLSIGRFMLDGGNHRLSSWDFRLCDL